MSSCKSKLEEKTTLPSNKIKNSKKRKYNACLETKNVFNLLEKLSQTPFDSSKKFDNVCAPLGPDMLKLRFVPRSLYLLEKGMTDYIDYKKQRIAHLEKSIANRNLLDISALNSIAVMQNLLKITFCTLQGQITNLTETLEHHSLTLTKRDVDLYPNLLRKLPVCLRQHVFTFLHVGYRFEPLKIKAASMLLTCKFNSDSNLFELYDNYHMQPSNLQFEANAMDLSTWFDSHASRFYWWSAFKVFEDGFTAKKGIMYSKNPKGSAAFIEAISTLSRKTERVTTASWKAKTLLDDSFSLQARKNTLDCKASMEEMRKKQRI